MTTPNDPVNTSADASPTEPVPAMPAFEPAQPSVAAFQPAAPEPMPVGAPVVATGSAIAPTPVVAKPARKSGGISILNVALGVAVLVATAGVAFAVGRTTAPAAAPTQLAGITPGGGRFFTNGGPGASFDPNGGFGAGPGANNGNGNGGRFGFGGGPTIQGTVDSVTEDSVTIKTADGNTITIGLDSTTTYHQQADATASDVEAGKTVILKLSGGFRPGNGNGNGNANGSGNGSVSLGTASDVTVVP